MPTTFAPDISSYDATCYDGKSRPMDWARCRDVDHVSLAVIKCSEYSADPAFTMNWKAARGILPRMAYHLFHPERTNAFSLIQQTIGIDFNDNDLICLDWEKTWLFMSKEAQRNAAFSLLCALKGQFDTMPYIYIGKPFADSMGLTTDLRFEPFKYWLAQWPYDGDALWSASQMNAFKARIRAGQMRPAYSFFGRTPDMWQFTSRCQPACLAGYTPAGCKKAIDFNAIYADVSH
jgi:GH25 family lysozyme M1 (1,4-beta-N-acetylmuramidase)